MVKLDNFIVSAFVTAGSPYELILATQLLPSLDKIGLKYNIEVVDNRGSWLKNVAQKPLSILHTMEKFLSYNVVCLDADCEVLQFPKLFTEIPEDCDIALHTLDWDCVDSETEILTENGWKNHNTIDKNEKAVTLNINTNTLELTQIEEVFKKEYNDIMYSLENSRTSRLITPNHKELYKKRYISKKQTTPYCFRIPSTLPKEDFLINKIDNWLGIDNNEFSIDELKLLAWFLTEGTIMWGSHKKKENNFQALSICQGKDIYKKEIEQLLVKLKYKYSICKYNSKNLEMFSFYVPKEFSSKYFNILKNKKLPSFITNLPKEKLEIFLLELLKGDGTLKYKDNKLKSFTFYQKDINFLSQVQEIAFKCGWASNIWENTICSSLMCGKRTLRYGFTHYKHKNKKYSNTYNPINYKGIIWCIHTKNNTIVCRRKSKVFITGNSWYQNNSHVKEVLSGTVWIRNNEKMRQFVKEWYLLADTADIWEQRCLDTLLKSKKDSIKVYNLPVNYCWISTLPDGKPPHIQCDNIIIKHNQASRTLKRQIRLK